MDIENVYFFHKLLKSFILRVLWIVSVNTLSLVCWVMCVSPKHHFSSEPNRSQTAGKPKLLDQFGGQTCIIEYKWQH
jgi:hypothetical protein